MRTALYYRFYRARRDHWRALFADAPLQFAPQFKMELWPQDDSHGEIAFTGFYELTLSRRIAADAHRGGFFVDVGANYGYFTLLWLSAAAQNRALAFEASPANHAPLRTNITRNHCVDRVEIHESAVGRESGTARFSLGGPGQTGWGGIAPEKSAAETVVPVTTLDQTICGNAIVDVLKIDVEGADTWVLQGAEKLLKERRIHQIYYEQNRGRMKALGVLESEAADFLRSVGYESSILTGEGTDIVEWQASPAN
jgi:FkbM family methyltransferase